jgi:hypothetical protein
MYMLGFMAYTGFYTSTTGIHKHQTLVFVPLAEGFITTSGTTAFKSLVE